MSILQKGNMIITLDSIKKILDEFNNQPKFKIKFSPFIDASLVYKMFTKDYEVWILNSKFETKFRKELSPELFITEDEFKNFYTDTFLNSFKHYIY